MTAMTPPSPGDAGDDEFVIGAEFAAAAEAERRHRAVHGGGSGPIGEARYAFWRGEHDLARFVPSPTDDVVSGVVAAFGSAGNDQRTTMRRDLTLDDFYTLLGFARRSAVRTLRHEDPAPAAAGAVAIAMIDPERVDWRDIPSALCLVYHALDRTTADAADVLSAAAHLAVDDVAAMLGGFAGPDAPHGGLAAWGYMEVSTPDGIGFFERHLGRYAPTCDLAAVALSAAAVFDSDAYRVHSIAAGAALAPVWFPRTAPGRLERLLDRAGGVISLGAKLHPDAGPTAAHQQLTAFLVETAGRADATRLTRWAAPIDTSEHAAVAVAAGPLACVTIARSFVAGVESQETTDSLRRFAAPLAEAITTT